MTQPSALEQLINAKVDERLAKVTTPYTFYRCKWLYPRLENPDFDSMSNIDKSGLFYAYNPVNSQIQKMKVVIYSLLHVVLRIRK